MAASPSCSIRARISAHFPFGRFLPFNAVVPPAFEESFDGPYQGFPAGAELADAVACDLFEEALSAWQERDENAAAVVAAACAAHVAMSFQAVDEFDGAVVF